MSHNGLYTIRAHTCLKSMHTTRRVPCTRVNLEIEGGKDAQYRTCTRTDFRIPEMSQNESQWLVFRGNRHSQWLVLVNRHTQDHFIQITGKSVLTMACI